MNDKLVLFNSGDSNVAIDVKLENENVWLSLNQLAQVFGRDKSVISRHLKNIFADNELKQDSTVAFFATVQQEGSRQIDRQIEYYNLDAILSVGYRVNSKQATAFRQWANKVLKDYLLQGYAINQNLINTTTNEYQSLLELLNKTLVNNQLITDTGHSVLNIINGYANTWSTLLQYDEDRLTIPGSIHSKNSIALDYAVAINIKTLAILKGHLPPRVLGLVIEWAETHQTELLDNWNSMRTSTKFNKIEPLI